jgi:thiamine-monophosphate kinase
VEGVHFLRGTDAAAIGYKALAVNLSDLAAMGAEPRWALLSLSLPTAVAAWVTDFARGFADLAAAHGVALVGGDTTRGPLSVTVQVIGTVPAGTALRRDGARKGDLVCVSGTIGDAALALAMLQSGVTPPPALQQRLDRPEPRVALGMRLREVAHAAIDVSDGIVADMQRILAASGVGATLEVDALPASPEFRSHGGTRANQMDGGDDYELLFTMRQDRMAMLDGMPVCVIGRVEEEPGLRCVAADGEAVMAGDGGFDHFGS